MTRLAVIGAGTAGCFSTSHFLGHTNWDIDWYLDPKTKPQAVGEGSNLLLPAALDRNIGFSVLDLDQVDGTFKTGLKKQNWGTHSETYYHLFTPGRVGYHFNAIRLQNYLRERFRQNPRVRIVEQAVTDHSSVDADLVLDCSGRPTDLTDFYRAEYIPVNSVHVTQCFWDYQRFNYTLTIARPYGWVFGIPLQNRCAIGYMYNNTINSLDDVKQDVQMIFDEYNLTPSDTTNTFSFANYYRRENYTGRVAYNGNASFFLEPLEATSIHFMDTTHRIAYDVFRGGMSIEQGCAEYLRKIREVETVIMMHYAAGSPFKTEFWQFAQHRGQECLQQSLTNPDFQQILAHAANYTASSPKLEFGTWDLYSFPINIQALGLWDQIKERQHAT